MRSSQISDWGGILVIIICRYASIIQFNLIYKHEWILTNLV